MIDIKINHYGFFVDYTIARSDALKANTFDEASGYTERARFSYSQKDMDPAFHSLLTDCYNNLDMMLTCRLVNNFDGYRDYESKEANSSKQLEALAIELSTNPK